MGAQHERVASRDGALRRFRRPAGPSPTPPRQAGRQPALRVEVITDLDVLDALADRWSALVRTSPHATAYASPAFVLTWYRHFERPGGIYAVTVWRGDDLVGMAPFARTRLGRGRAGVTLLVSAGTEHGDYGDPLLGPDPGPVADAIADHLAAAVRRGVVVNVRRLRSDSATLAALEGRDDLARAPMGQVAEAAVVRFDAGDDPEVHLKRLGKKHGVPRRMRRLADAHGTVDYTPDDPDIGGALDAMEDMLARRWGPEDGPSLFHAPRLASFTRETMAALVDSGFGRVATMWAGGRLVAVSTALEVGDRIVSDNVAYDPDLAEFGLGQAEMHMMLCHAHGSGVVEVDMRAGDFPYKRRWANASHTTRSVVLAAPGRQGAAMMRARSVAMSVRARRLGRLRQSLPGAFGGGKRGWLLAVTLVVGVATGDPTATSPLAGLDLVA